MDSGGVRLAVDFGTSSTVGVLLLPAGRIRQLLFDGTPLLPSAVFAGTAGLLVGGDALHAAQVRPDALELTPKQRIDEGTVLLGEREVPVAQLIGAVLARVAAEATRTAGQPPSEVTLTCPVAWAAPRREVLLAAARYAGLGAVRLVAEPVAAATHFGRLAALPPGGCALVYDFGAGTFDVSLLHRAPDGLVVLACDGLADAGGMDIDAAIVDSFATTYGARDLPGWQRLLQPQTVEDRRAYRQLWQDVRRAKELLSRSPATEVHLPVLEVDAPLGREQLEQLARPVVERTVACTQALLRGARPAAENLAGVFLTGGSSRLPLVATLLHRALGIAPTAVEQPELAVVEGALFTPAIPATAPAAAPPVGGEGAGRPPMRPSITARPPGRRRRSRPLLMAAILALAVVAVGLPYALTHRALTPSGTPTCHRKLAVLDERSGPSAAVTTSVFHAAELAVAQYNQLHPGCEVGLVESDIASPDTGELAARGIVRDPAVIGLVGPEDDGEVTAVAPVLQAAQLPMISPSASGPSLDTHGWTVFHRITGTDTEEAKAAAWYLTHRLQAHRVYLVDDQSEYSHDLVTTVQATLGNQVAGSTTVINVQESFGTVLTQSKNLKADAVYFPGFASQATLMLSQLRGDQNNAQFLGSTLLLDDQAFGTAAAAGGAALTCLCRPPTGSTAAAAFNDQYQQKFHLPPGDYGGYGYDATQILLNGIGAGVGNRAGMLAYLRSSDHTGIMGSYRFTSTGDLAPDRVHVSIFTPAPQASQYQTVVSPG